MNFADMQGCICGNLRKTTRVVTQFYDQRLQTTGLRTTQCALLHSILIHENSTVGELAESLLMDQSTITRNLEVLKRHGFITSTPTAHDGRIKMVVITPAGKNILEEALPLWEDAQCEIKEKLGRHFDGFLLTLQAINERVR